MNQQDRVNAQRRILEEQIQKQFAELQKHKPNILVVGRTGVGKSSLINTILGQKVAETGSGKPITQSYEIYSHPLVTMIDSKGWEGGSAGEQHFRDDTRRLLNDRRTTNPDDHIHVVWYVIAASDARFQEFDARLVREAFGGIPVLFVLTKCDIASEAAVAQVEQAIKASVMQMGQQATKNNPAPRVVGIIRTAADPLPVFQKPAWGMQELVEATRAELPDLYRNAFDAAQAVDFAQKGRRAQAIVLATAATAGAVGATPIPFSDSLILTPLQSAMVASIGLIYGFGADPGTLTALISGTITPLVAESAGITLAGNLLKMFPGAGTLIGGAIEGGVAASITATIGYGFIRAFHQLALMKAQGKEVTLASAGDFLKQTLPQIAQEVNKRGYKNLLPDGNEK